MTMLYLWDMGTYWECRFCHRRWRKQEPLSQLNADYLLDHVNDHTGMKRKRPEDIPALVEHLDDDEIPF